MVSVKDKKFSVKTFEHFEKFQHGLFSWQNLNQNGIFAPGGTFCPPKSILTAFRSMWNWF